MTLNQLEHEREQSEAARRQFHILWHDGMRNHAVALGLDDPRKLWVCEEIAWQAFRAGQEVAK